MFFFFLVLCACSEETPVYGGKVSLPEKAEKINKTEQNLNPQSRYAKYSQKFHHSQHIVQSDNLNKKIDLFEKTSEFLFREKNRDPNSYLHSNYLEYFQIFSRLSIDLNDSKEQMSAQQITLFSKKMLLFRETFLNNCNDNSSSNCELIKKVMTDLLRFGIL